MPRVKVKMEVEISFSDRVMLKVYHERLKEDFIDVVTNAITDEILGTHTDARLCVEARAAFIDCDENVFKD